jgi:uncharacterized membrane protein YhhN
MRWLINRLGWMKVPIAAYLVITLVLPLLHGAAKRADFVAHAVWVLAGCGLVVIAALAVAGVIDVALHLTRKDRP